MLQMRDVRGGRGHPTRQVAAGQEDASTRWRLLAQDASFQPGTCPSVRESNRRAFYGAARGPAHQNDLASSSTKPTMVNYEATAAITALVLFVIFVQAGAMRFACEECHVLAKKCKNSSGR